MIVIKKRRCTLQVVLFLVVAFCLGGAVVVSACASHKTKTKIKIKIKEKMVRYIVLELA